MLSHFLLMVLYALVVSLFFTLLWRRERQGAGQALPPDLPGDGRGRPAGGLAHVSVPAPARPPRFHDRAAMPSRGAAGGRRRSLGRPARRAAHLRAAPPGARAACRSASAATRCARPGSSPWPTARRSRWWASPRSLKVLPRVARDLRRACSSEVDRRRPGRGRAGRLPGLQPPPGPASSRARASRWSTTSAPRSGPGGAGACSTIARIGRPHAGPLPLRGGASTAVMASTWSTSAIRWWTRCPRSPRPGTADEPGARPSAVPAGAAARARG